MRVLLVHNRYRHPGGEERHVELLAHHLRAAGVAADVLELDSQEVRDDRIAMIRAGFRTPYSRAGAAVVRERLRHHPADVVHFHNLWPLLTPAALRAARTAGARVALTLHNYRFACPSGTLFANERRHLSCLRGSSLACAVRHSGTPFGQRLVYGVSLALQRRFDMLNRWVDVFVAPSAYIRRRAIEAGIDGRRVIVVHNGINLPPPVRSVGHEFVLYAGRLSVEKGLNVLLTAASKLPHRQFVVAGAGPLDKRARPSNVRLIGVVNGNVLSGLRSRSQMAVVPSLCDDVLPFAAIESLAHSRPVVASSVGGIPEIVVDARTGLLVPPNDAGALAAAIERLCSDKTARETFGRNGRADAERRFDARVQAQHVLAAYLAAAREEVAVL